MSGKQDAYGNSGGGDTDFRKTWDREEMAKKAQIREKKEREEAKERYEAKVAGKTYRRRASTPEDLKNVEARTDRIDYKSMIGKTSLVPAGAGVGRRGKSAGIYCSVCDETYRDNIAYIEHTNSQRHLVASGLSNTVERADATKVRERLRYLKRKREEEAALEVLDLDSRLEINKEQMDKEAEERRRKRNERRRKKPAADSNAMVWNVEGDGIIS